MTAKKFEKGYLRGSRAFCLICILAAAAALGVGYFLLDRSPTTTVVPYRTIPTDQRTIPEETPPIPPKEFQVPSILV